MKGILTVMFKEVRDNLRDRRSLFFAFIFGPLLMPVLMLGPIVVKANKNIQSYDSGRELHVYGSEYAPNLTQHLRSKNLDAARVGEGFEEQLKNGDLKLVLEITENYREKLLAGEPARVIIHYLEEDRDSRNFFWQVKGELDNYSRNLASHRMLIRGVDKNLFRPIDITEDDLSEDEFRSGIVASIIIFLVVYSCMMGGYHLAVDTTAGERERNSLEPLLSLALTRTQVVLGKYFSILLFCVVAYILPITSAAILASFLPESFFGNADVPNVMTYLKLLVLMLPVCLLLSSSLMTIAAFSKSVKEAQTQTGLVIFIPMAPFFMVQFMDIKSDAINESIPVMGQYLLADKIMMDSTYTMTNILSGSLTTLLLAALCLVITTVLYRQDRILS